MATASVLKVDQPYMSIIVYQDVVLVKIAVGSADISRQRDRCASCSLDRIRKRAAAVQCFKSQFLLSLHRFQVVRSALFQAVPPVAKQLLVVLGQVVGL